MPESSNTSTEASVTSLAEHTAVQLRKRVESLESEIATGKDSHVSYNPVCLVSAPEPGTSAAERSEHYTRLLKDVVAVEHRARLHVHLQRFDMDYNIVIDEAANTFTTGADLPVAGGTEFKMVTAPLADLADFWLNAGSVVNQE